MNETRSEMDSHTDTCVVGSNALIFHETMRYVTVAPFTDTLGTLDHRPIVSAAIAHDDHETGEVIILACHQAILIEELDKNLLCPMQMRMNDVRINECPKFLTADPTDLSHAITFPNEDGYTIPLSLNGVTSFFWTRKPTKWEFETCRRIDITSELPKWNPHSLSFREQEEGMVDSFGRAREPLDHHRYANRLFCVLQSAQQHNSRLHGRDQERAQTLSDRTSQCSSILSDFSNTLNDDEFHESLAANVNTHLVSSTSAFKTSNRKHKTTPEQLVKTWGIGIETAKRTLQSTTQRGIKTVANPSISRRFRTNDRQLRYRRLASDMFSDTMFAGTPSKRGNRAHIGDRGTIAVLNGIYFCTFCTRTTTHFQKSF